MTIGGVDIFENENRQLVLKKKKSQAYISFIIFFLMFFIVLLSVLYIYQNIGAEAEIDFYLIFAVLAGSVTIIFIFYFNLRRVIKNSATYVLYFQENKIIINKVPFCDRGNLGDIIIQTVHGWEGGEPSYTIGLSCKKSFYPLSFSQTLDDAKAIAGILAHYFQKSILVRKSKMFPIFYGH